ncbi:S-layer homology domain-containing protein [Psychrobacillus sp. NPDC096623]|uniref:S-layer homology domain-containing protein n=1 Tax=Psychrobacillus sp. NPDC096623 TaxID=3364492 RepID=UPI0037FC0877
MKKLEFILLIAILTVGFNMSVLAASHFKDVSEKEWSYPIIEELSRSGVIEGYSDVSFRPANGVTRAQSAIYIGRALNIETKNRPNPGFVDVNSKTTGYEYIAALVDEGVYAKATNFNPHESLTRAQMAKILVIAFELKGSKKTSFTDLPANGWAKPYVEILVANGVTTGASATKFSPNRTVSRLQMAIFIYRTLRNDEEIIAPPPIENPEEAPDNLRATELLKLVNEERIKSDLKPLVYDTTVEKVANIKAQDMKTNNYFDHISPTYGSPSNMLTKFGVYWTASGENIAAGYSSVNAVHKGWMNSSGHRANILSSSYTHVGFGYAEGGGKYGNYWVQMFIRK